MHVLLIKKKIVLIHW